MVAVGLLLALEWPGLPVVTGLAAGLTAGATTTEAWAQRSSGGYSRSSGGSSSRTPSFGGSSSSSRTPSFGSSGGYSRSYPSSRTPSVGYGGMSSSDRSYSQEQSGRALQDFRAQQERARRPVEPPTYRDSPAPSYGQPSYSQPNYAPPSYQPPSGYRGYQAPNRGDWYVDRGWSAPPPALYGGQRSFGIWDGLFLWSLLNNLNRPSASDFFYNRQNDPGYQQWRAEAERLGRENADIRDKLAELDRRMAERQGQPRDPDYLPPDIPKEIVAAPPPARTPSVSAAGGGGGSIIVWVVIGAGIVLFAFLAWRRMRAGVPATGIGASPMTPLQSASAILKHKLSGETYTPERFRVGMTLAVDPTPFILASGAVKVSQPDAGGSQVLSVTEVGRIGSGSGQLTRLYLPDGCSMVQVHLDAAGAPDECRLFGIIDEVTPADRDEWGAWLDPNEGMIGWPDFQTKDGKSYGRVWAPGSSRVEPRTEDEVIQGVSGTRTVSSQSMLYGAPTGAPEPAPQTEYILVSAKEEGGRAWVEIRAGIDISPTTLQLA